MTVIDTDERPRAQPRPCDACPAHACEFSRGRVYFFLLVAHQAKLLGEPFDAVLVARTRSSRGIDPWLRGGGRGAAYAHTIWLTLLAVQTRHGIDITNPHNADRVAGILCPDRWDESVDDQE